MSSRVFETDWNVVVNLGIKCNTLAISRSAKVRYYSSPFDNMDTVDGIVDCANLMASGFDGYFDDIKEWDIKNEIPPRSTEIRNKIMWHKDSPAVYYPHFAEVWFEGNLTEEELHDWKHSDVLDINPVWDDMKRVFGNRQQRLASQLRSNNKILFFRADQRGQLKRAHGTNQDEHLEEFISTMRTAYPQTEIGLLYLYCNNPRFQRELTSTEWVHTELIPEGAVESEYAIERLGELDVLPRDEMHPIDFDAECSDTE